MLTPEEYKKDKEKERLQAQGLVDAINKEESERFPTSIVTNERGGKQSKITGMTTEVPPIALLEVAKVMQIGVTRYPREDDGTPNWYRIDCYSNLDHAMEHLCNFLAERNRPHTPVNTKKLLFMKEELSHFTARAMMALEMFLREEMYK